MSTPSVRRLTGDDAGTVLSGGSEIDVDFVIFGVGITPLTPLAEEAGLDIENGIRIDEFGCASDPGIFAAGDCASFPYKNGQIRTESVGNAIDRAKAVAENMLCAMTPYHAKHRLWFDQYDVKPQIAGLNVGYDRIVTRRKGDGQLLALCR